jgi:hypothetical protein
MNDIIFVISGMDGLVSGKGVSKEVVAAAERKLAVAFAKDYAAYVEEFGTISANDTELTGIVDSKRLNVIDVTIEEREMSGIPQDMYVVEDTHIEGILVLQNSKGEIYKHYGKNSTKKIFDCLSDYLISKRKNIPSAAV